MEFFFPAQKEVIKSNHESGGVKVCIPAFFEGRYQRERGALWAPAPGKSSLASLSRRVVWPLLRMSGSILLAYPSF